MLGIVHAHLKAYEARRARGMASKECRHPHPGRKCHHLSSFVSWEDVGYGCRASFRLKLQRIGVWRNLFGRLMRGKLSYIGAEVNSWPNSPARFAARSHNQRPKRLTSVRLAPIRRSV